MHLLEYFRSQCTLDSREGLRVGNLLGTNVSEDPVDHVGSHFALVIWN